MFELPYLITSVLENHNILLPWESCNLLIIMREFKVKTYYLQLRLIIKSKNLDEKYNKENKIYLKKLKKKCQKFAICLNCFFNKKTILMNQSRKYSIFKLF